MASEYLFYKDKILQLESRRQIHNLIKKYAGCHFRYIQRKTKFPPSSLRYHLNYLARRRLILEEKVGNNIRYFPIEFDTNNKILLSLLRQDNVRKILIYLLNNKNSSFEDIVGFVKLSPSTVSWHLKKLLSKQVVKANKDKKAVRYILLVDEKEIMNLLITYQESFLDSLVNKTIEMWEIG